MGYMDEESTPLTRDQLLDMLQELVQSYDRMPSHAMMTPITHYEMQSLSILLLSILRTSNNNEV